jgi:hypothetical protein
MKDPPNPQYGFYRTAGAIFCGVRRRRLVLIFYIFILSQALSLCKDSAPDTELFYIFSYRRQVTNCAF